jgi:C-terminal peptidase prc
LAAEDKATPAQIYAVIVGVGEFKDAQIKARPTAIADAQALYDVLTDKAAGGIPADHVQLLVSAKDEKRGAKEATKANLVAAFKDAAGKVTKDDRLIVVWVGQGAPIGDRTCLFASDSTFKERAKDAFTVADLESAVKNLKAKEVFALLDLNLKAFDPGKEAVLEPNEMDIVRVLMGMKEKDDAEPPQGRAVILAGSGINPVVTVEDKSGIFTTAVVDALRGAADKDGYEPDGLVTVDELTKYLEDKIPELARKYGKSEEARQQLPFVIARGSHYAVSKNPGVTAKVEGRLEKLEKLNKEQKVTNEVAEEGKRLLSRMPTLKDLQELRKNYQALTDGTLNVKDFTEAREKLLAGMKLDEDAAKKYAGKVVDGLKRFKKDYIKELDLGEMTANAVKGIYAIADQKVPPEIAERLDKAKGMDVSDLESLLADARVPLGKREDLDKDRDVEISLHAGIAKFVDPYTTYVDKEKVEEVEKDVQGFFTGIGVQIRRDLSKDALLVVSPIKGSPAYKAGLKAGDWITSIRREVDANGKPLDKPEVTSTKGMKVQDAVKIILGKPGTKVKIMVERPGGEKPKEYEITRGLVEVETVLGYKRKDDDSWDYFVDTEHKIAYIHLTQFSRNSLYDMDKAVKQLEKQGVKGVILDVRNNPGGYLNVAHDICDLFIDDGLIVSIRPRTEKGYSVIGRTESVHYQDGKPDYPFGSHTSFPMAVLINGNSASASEILGACLQDQNRAVIVGERSYGKGSVQNIRKFAATGGEIKLTTATFWRPNGKNLNKASTKGTDEEDWGVRPTKGYTVKLDPAERFALDERLRDWVNIPNREAKSKEPEKDFRDRQLETALDYVRGQVKLMKEKQTAKKDG